jgi:arylsulfatase A-like enzyme
MKRPNIVMIVTDQQRADTIHGLGNDLIKTPALDRLVREGTAFRRAYTPCPVCAPARGALATGVAPHVAHQADNIRGGRADLPDMYSMLKEAGYQTFGVGKYGINMDRGAAGYESFDRFIESTEYFEWIDKQGLPNLGRSVGYTNEYYYLPTPMPYPERYSKPHWTADNAVAFIQNRRADAPFLLCAHFGRPHPPFVLPYPWTFLYRGSEMPYPERPANYREYQWRMNRVQNRFKWMDGAAGGDDRLIRTIRAAYYATVSYTDFQIGRILEALGGEIDNTLVMFTTDHGEMLGDYGCFGKRCMLEAAVRVPLIARLPGMFEAGRECRAPATLLDFMPTVCEAAELECPDLDEAMPLSRVAEMEPGSRTVFSQFSRRWNAEYFASDGERSYVYSTADEREWNYALSDELVQGPILDRDDAGERLRTALIDRHRGDDFSLAVDGDDWRRHDIPADPIDSDPDHGMLFAEPSEKIQADVNALGSGYARRVTGIEKGNSLAENLVPLTEEERRLLGRE